MSVYELGTLNHHYFSLIRLSEARICFEIMQGELKKKLSGRDIGVKMMVYCPYWRALIK
jgi:hypothetical protein